MRAPAPIVMDELETPAGLRIAPAARLEHYFRKRGDSLRFYRRARHHGEQPPAAFQQEYALFHSWLPGFIEIDSATAEKLRQWIREEGPAPVLPSTLRREIAARGWCTAAAPQLDHLLEKAFSVFPAIQNPKELRCFLDEIALRVPRTVMEIGTAGGGVLYCLCQLAHSEALLISVDFPGGQYGEGQDEQECELFSSFVGVRQRLECIRDRSLHYSTLCDVEKLLAGRRIDLLFIDGDHSYGGAKSDFEMYGRFVAPGGLIVFHDIMMFPETWGRGFDVGLFWRELAKTRPTREIVDLHAPRIPPPPEEAERWGMPALGFGLVTSA